MDLFDDEIYFENWTGASVRGKENLRKAWAPWFANHGDFKFTTEETFIDEVEQKMLFRWQLDSPSFEKGQGRQTRSQTRPRYSALQGRQDRAEADLLQDHGRTGRGTGASDGGVMPVPRIKVDLAPPEGSREACGLSSLPLRHARPPYGMARASQV